MLGHPQSTTLRIRVGADVDVLTRRARRLGIALLAACAVTAPLASAAPAPATVDAFGFWSLTRLGVTQPVDLDPAQASPVAAVPVAFMAGARQGPASWYLGHLHATVQLSSGTHGSVYLDAAVGKWDWAQVRITRVSRGGTVHTEWRSAGALQGGSSGSAVGNSAHIVFANFLPTSAVRPGPTALTFRLERYGDLRVRRVTIGQASGLEYSRLGPARLTASISGPHTAARGSTTSIVVRLRNIGDRPLFHLLVGWDQVSKAVTLAPQARRVSALAAHLSTQVTFRLHAKHAGRATLYLTALGAGAGVTQRFTVRVRG